MVPVDVLTSPPVTTSRLAHLDRARGLAVVFMVVDHVALVLGVLDVLRLTVGRLAMPLFFLVAGALVRRLSWRHGAVLVVGLALPVLVPWVDAPNVLVLYVLSAALVVAARRVGWPVWSLIVPALLVLANGWSVRVGSSFDVLAALALVALGAFLGPARVWPGAARLPALLEVVGRRPLTVYVGHLLALQGGVLLTSVLV